MENRKQSQPQAEFICGRCGSFNIVNSSNIIKQDVWTEEGMYYRILYSKCKQCKEPMLLQIDDLETITLYKEFKELLLKTMKKNLRNQTVSPKDEKKKDKLVKKLSRERENLRDDLEGKKLYDNNKNFIIKA